MSFSGGRKSHMGAKRKMKASGEDVLQVRLLFAVATSCVFMLVIGVAGALAGGGAAAERRDASESLRSSVRLGLSRQSVGPGGTIKSRVSNGSQTDISYGQARSLQRLEGGGGSSSPKSRSSCRSLWCEQVTSADGSRYQFP